MTTNATGGTEKLYKVNVYDGKTWRVLQNYSTSNTFKWIPSRAGDYKFSIHVKDKNSSKAYDDYGVLYYQVSEPVKVNSLTVDKASPQVAGTDVTLKANVTQTTDILYAFHVYDGTAWKVLKDYSTSDQFTWTPESGEYKVVVHVKHKDSVNKYDSYAYINYSVLKGPVALTQIETDRQSPQLVNASITLTAQAIGLGNKLYAFYVFDGTDWKQLREYNLSNSFIWTPTKPGTYKFSVHVKQEGSVNAYDDYMTLDYKITTAPVQVQSIDVDKGSPQPAGVPITLTTNATGGTEKLYKVNVYDGKTWRVLQNYSTSNTLKWIPSRAGDYKFSIHVKDKNSSKAYDDYGVLYYQVSEPVKVNSLTVDKASPQVAGTDVTLKANVTQTTDILYAFHVYDGTAWKVLRDYSTSDQFTWTPESGEYKVVVHVKHKDSVNKYDSYAYINYSVKIQ
ncbi:hypothetical protein KO561_01355 [Radiobacillus kanasensis]|uniref:triple tyrosine motif-containing protein n=1 Tax=Radiobacillus kanasensis TaxID=2844358 RepID=UPI001E395956|nr:triple tyrosine motif-containing protein [Radiobacillus kanasensis]UFT99652.1 hypothetical protein KO561_01355 [Radiobacillus kanasensis]